MDTRSRFDGRYEIEEVLGSGGMAQVYRARDGVLGRTVAIKVLAAGLSADAKFVERFRREARAAASLNHPNIVTVYDSGSENGTHYLVMQLIDGRTLAEVIAADAPLAADRVAGIAADVCSALGAAHARGIIHCDVKPANVILTRQGNVKLADFGIARAAEGTSLTKTATILGTADYLSPERALGGSVDARSDLYSLGVVVYEMLCGRVPFTGPTAAAVADQHARAKPEPPSRWNPSVPAALEAVVVSALQKDPARRPQDAAEMRDRLLKSVRGALPEPTRAVPRRPTELLRRVRPRGMPLWARLISAYGLVVAATLLVVSGLAVHFTRTHLARSVDERLAAAVRSFQTGPARGVRAPEDLAPLAREWLAASAFPGDQVAAVRTSAGEVLTSSGGIDLERLRGARDVLESTRSRWWDVDGVRAISVPLVLREAQAGTLVVAASHARLDATVGGLVSGIGWAALTGMLFAGFVGTVLLRRALQPLRRMSAEVEAIKATGDLTRRVAQGEALDEVGRLAQEFNRLLDELQRAFVRQRRFLSDASHELRTPLTVARGRLELLQDELEAPEARLSLGQAVGELDRMARIVEDLLLLARLDEGLQIDSRPVEVELVLREALLRGLQLGRRESQVEATHGLFALGDPDRLLQVITNLVANAVRHAGDDARIALAARRDGDRVLIEVSDTGTGIPEDELPQIFERFHRGGRARGSSPEGAGLGLPIAHSLVRAMGGDINVRSAPGEGSTFTVLLPAAP